VADAHSFASTGRYHSWGSAQGDAPPTGVTDATQSTPPARYPPESTRTILGKRPRREDNPTGDYIQVIPPGTSTRGPSKRAKGKIGVLEAAGSTSRARQNSATKTLVNNRNRSEATGRGAGKLTATNAHEVYYESLPGPSVQQELVVTTAQGEQPWIEGSTEEATWNPTSGDVWQQQIANSANDGDREDVGARSFRIPKRLTERQRGLLEATPDDLERKTVREIKCRLCPGTGIGDWEDYRRHCNSMEAHPLRLSFCESCGDFFARTDSLARHRKSPPAECCEVTPDEAKAKQTVAEQVHRDFEERLKCYLETNEEIGEPFAQRVKAMFSTTSKRGSRQQSRLKGPTA
jgi:hypothetical protein